MVCRPLQAHCLHEHTFVTPTGGRVKEGRRQTMVGDKGEGTRAPGKGWRVAICEPDALTRRAIENIFEGAGFVVMSAADIEELETRMPEKAKGSPPPVIVTDAGCVKGWLAEELF